MSEKFTRCEGRVKLLGFLWKTRCNYPLVSKSSVCWRCGTKGPKHPDVLFWQKLKSQTTLNWMQTKQDIPARTGNEIKFFHYDLSNKVDME